MPDAPLLATIADLSIGALSVCGFVYLMVLAHKQSEAHNLRDEKKTTEFLNELTKREEAMRMLEKEVRENILRQLGENTHLMTKIIDYLDRPELRPRKRKEYAD